MPPLTDEKFWVPKGCNICRIGKVKCDERRPSCARCLKLERRCSWPSPKQRLRISRRGPGSFKSRESHQNLVAILPHEKPTTDNSIGDQTQDAGASSMSMSNSLAMMNPSFGYDENNLSFDMSFDISDMSFDMSFDLDNFRDFHNLEYLDELYLPSAIHTVGSDNASSIAPITINTGQVEMGSFIHQSLSDRHIPLSNSMELGPEGRSALGHYQTTFSIYRTTKKPSWSTHSLLLKKFGNKNSMIMNFILAVSINDISHRRELDQSQEAHDHFKVGESALMSTIKGDSSEDHISSMVAFLLVFLYIPKRRDIPRDRIDQHSKIVLEYVRKHQLDSRCLERLSTISPPSDDFSDRDRALLARLIIWIYDEDVKCSFQGFGGYFAAHLTLHRERTMAVYEVSRTALVAHWGSDYPPEESVDDDDNAVELELLWALTALWQDINQLPQGTDENCSSVHHIHRRFKMLEKKYNIVFQNSAHTTMPRTRTLINSDYDVILFHALKVYLFRSTISDLQMETPEDIKATLKILLNIIERTFLSHRNELHDRLQWPLFLVGIEIGHGFPRICIIERLSKRPRAVLEKIIELQDRFGSWQRLDMGTIRQLLHGGDGNDGGASTLSRLDYGSLLDVVG